MIELPTSSAHHAHFSPRRNAVAATAIATSENPEPYAPYNRKSSVMKSATFGDAAASSCHELYVKRAKPTSRIGAPPGPNRYFGASAAIAHHARRPASATWMRIEAIRRLVVPASDSVWI